MSIIHCPECASATFLSDIDEYQCVVCHKRFVIKAGKKRLMDKDEIRMTLYSSTQVDIYTYGANEICIKNRDSGLTVIVSPSRNGFEVISENEKGEFVLTKSRYGKNACDIKPLS